MIYMLIQCGKLIASTRTGTASRSAWYTLEPAWQFAHNLLLLPSTHSVVCVYVYTVMWGTIIVTRTHDIHKNLYITGLLLKVSILGPE